MATHSRSIKKSRRPALKLPKSVKNAAQRIWDGIRYIWDRPYVVAIILLILAGVLLNLLVTQTFKPYFNCAYLIGSGLNTNVLCQGYTFRLDLGLTTVNIPILPALKALDPPLEVFRQFISWNIVLFFALLSLVLAFIVSKMVGFVRLLRTEQGRKIVLTNVSIWLLFFVIFCSLFYFKIVR